MDTLLRDALKAGDPGRALYFAAVKLRDAGVTQVDLYRMFEQILIQTSPEEPLCDAIADNMDLIWGGAHAKGQALFPEELSSERLRE